MPGGTQSDCPVKIDLAKWFRTGGDEAAAREVLGYAPQDDSEVRFAADIARLLGSGQAELPHESGQ